MLTWDASTRTKWKNVFFFVMSPFKSQLSLSSVWVERVKTCHVRLLLAEAIFDCTVFPREDFCMNVLNDPVVVARQQLPSSALFSAVTPAQGLEAATQRVQYCWGVSPHASDSRSVSVTRAAGAEAGNKLSGLMVLETLSWPNHALCRELLCKFNPPVVLVKTRLQPLCSRLKLTLLMCVYIV